MSENVYIFEVHKINGKTKYIAIAKKLIAKDDLMFGELTLKGRIKFGLAPTDKAEIIDSQALNLDNTVSSNIVKDIDGKKVAVYTFFIPPDEDGWMK